jgi:hypothetical protein
MRRAGNLFAVALLVLFVLTVVVGGLQYLASGTIRSARQAMQADDSLARADGLMQLLVSRWKQQAGFQTSNPITSPTSGTESGFWDSRAFVLGWERADLALAAQRASVWVRFPEDKPARTVRFDLRLTVPTPLQPRIAQLTRVSFDQVDPSSQLQRSAAFGATTTATVEYRREATVDALGAKISALAALGKTPAELEAAVDPAQLTGAIDTLADIQDALASLRARTSADPEATAERIVTGAASLPAENRRAFEDLGRLATAEEYGRSAKALSGPARPAKFAQAAAKLDEILNQPDESCGAMMVAYRQAQLMVAARPAGSSPTQIALTLAAAKGVVRSTANKKPKAPAHRFTDIKREELESFFSMLTTERLATSLDTPSGFLLTSVDPDGNNAIIHAESGTLLRAQAWSPDGGRVLAESSRIDGSGIYSTLWELGGGSGSGAVYRDVVNLTDGSTVMWLSSFGMTQGGNVSAMCGLGQKSNPGGGFGKMTVLFRGDQHVVLGNATPLFFGLSLWQDYLSALSPDGSRIAMENQTTRGVWVGSTDSVLAGAPNPPFAATLPAPLAPLTGSFSWLDWAEVGGRQWLIATVTDPTAITVHFLDASGAVPVLVASRSVPNTEPGALGASARLIASPPGALLAATSKLWYLPLPGSSAPIEDWSGGQSWPLPSPYQVSISASRRKLYLTRTDPAFSSPSTLWSMDTTSRQFKQLFGPGTYFATYRNIYGLAPSPFFEEAP